MLKEADKDVKEKGMTIRKAARVHGLPESTFRWRLAKGKSVDVKRGGPTFFTPAQEELNCWQNIVSQWLILVMGLPDGK
jgi:transposase-like protein